MLSVRGSLEWSITLHYLTAVNVKVSLLWVLETECLKVTFTDRCAHLEVCAACLRTLWMCTDRCTFSLIAHLQSAVFTPLCLCAFVNSVAHLQILLTRAVSKVFGVPLSVVLLRWVGWTLYSCIARWWPIHLAPVCFGGGQVLGTLFYYGQHW